MEKKYRGVRGALTVVVYTAKVSSVTPNAASIRTGNLPPCIWLNTQVLMMICRRFRINVVSTMVSTAAPCATIPAAIISLAPPYTVKDISTVCQVLRPAWRAITP